MLVTQSYPFMGLGQAQGLSAAEIEATARRIYEMGGGHWSSMSISGVEAMFQLVPQISREAVARRAIELGANATSIKRSLDWANAKEGVPATTTIPAAPWYKNWKIWTAVGVVVLGAAGLTYAFTRRR